MWAVARFHGALLGVTFGRSLDTTRRVVNVETGETAVLIDVCEAFWYCEYGSRQSLAVSSDGSRLYMAVWQVIVEFDLLKPVGHPAFWRIVAGGSQGRDFHGFVNGPGHIARFGNLNGFLSLSPDDKILYFVDRHSNSESMWFRLWLLTVWRRALI